MHENSLELNCDKESWIALVGAGERVARGIVEDTIMTGYLIRNVATNDLSDGGRRPLEADAEYALQHFPHRPLPIVINDHNQVIAGHDLWARAIEDGLARVPTIRVCDLRATANAPCWPFSLEQQRQLHLKATMYDVADLVAPCDFLYSSEAVQRAQHTVSDIGFYLPLLIDDTNSVIFGEVYLTAARRRGMQQVPAVALSSLNAFERSRFVEMMERQLNRLLVAARQT
ncbi:MAG: hypothetical protein K2X34_00480 [Hyphomonadaceae bacterium]|nr:hypothetical protein [Hyphomonadaceae bacterium]